MLPYLETLVKDIHFQQNCYRAITMGWFKDRLHFKIKNRPLKDKKWKEKVQKMLNFLFVEPVTRASTLVPREHYFLVSKTAGFLNYPRTKGYTKNEKCIPSGSFKHQRIRDPPLVIGCKAARWKEKGEEHICLRWLPRVNWPCAA